MVLYLKRSESWENSFHVLCIHERIIVQKLRHSGQVGFQVDLDDASHRAARFGRDEFVYGNTVLDRIVLNQGCPGLLMLEQIKSGQLWVISRRRRNGLILCKKFHAEFAGPGAAVGGKIDQDCEAIFPVGNLLLLPPESQEDQQRAYLIRRQWIRLTQQFTESDTALERARMILSQFENYFDPGTLDDMPDDIFAKLVGVFPKTIQEIRRQSAA